MATATAPEELARDLMTPDPVCLTPTTTVREAAGTMRARDVGDVLLVDGERQLSGIVTDRDLVVRCLAEGLDPDITPISAAASLADVRSGEPGHAGRGGHGPHASQRDPTVAGLCRRSADRDHQPRRPRRRPGPHFGVGDDQRCDAEPLGAPSERR
jgi:CBS domain-containing protein